jgi:tetratricopeptide (TPR) repeat protein
LDEPVSPSRLAPKLPRDLETICLKCLQKEPAKRYASAAFLADDLQRFLRGEPIQARPVPAWERAWKAAKRRPATAVSLLATLLAVVVAVGVVLVKNSQLARERDTAAQARENAEKQRALAQARLEKAVDAVERIMTRAAGEKWASDPALMSERREILEDAVAWFQSFGEEDSRDPIVRRQAGRAYLQCAAVYIALADYDRSRFMTDRAVSAFRSLGDEFPNDAIAFRGLAESTTMLGHLDLMAAKYQQARDHYEEAARIAENAIRIDPENSESEVVLADAQLAMAMLLANTDPVKAGEHNRRVLAIAQKLVANPSAGWRARQLIFTVIVNMGVSYVAQGAPDVGYTMFKSALTTLLAFSGTQPPNAYAAQMFAVSKAELDVHYGAQLVRRGKSDEGLKSVQNGLADIDRLLTAQPKSFPLRIQKLQLQLIAAEVFVRLGRSRDAESLFAQLDRGRTQLLAEMPQMTWLKDLGFVQHSLLLVELARASRAAEVESGFREILKKSQGRSQSTVRYNAACAFAQLSRSGSAGDRERFARRAVELLDGLLAANFFRVPQTNNHLDDDTDLDPLRARPDFREFLAKAKAQRPKK